MTPEGTIPWCGVKGESLAGQSFSCHNSRVSLPRISLFSSPSCAAGQRPSSAISEVMPVPHPGCFPKECVLHPKSIHGDKRQKKNPWRNTRKGSGRPQASCVQQPQLKSSQDLTIFGFSRTFCQGEQILESQSSPIFSPLWM